ncbi:amino acid transporter-like protein [Melanomma pulvis-pyrius CBS 109.77]|uniref:Amino acid transporter-like protein n=1 Tax=Melanomma pulvis-pyrius CBS 109.77 TaxID=1314802 RepID=A0A6A6X192_9PLEO|nr:amino acid transporter-like protein [Melanomma pulvis-pyrius CBS 109.77]
MAIEPASKSTVDPTPPLYAYEKADATIEEGARSGWNDTRQDEIDMKRLGKKQEFKRNFGFLSTLGFVSIYMATWEFVLVSLSAGFINGGLAGLFWMFIATVICYSTIVASLAEMASMAPTSGGQYHWTSEFAPPKLQKWLSYASGWMSTLGWIASTSSAAFVVTTLIEAMIEITDADFAFKNWQYTLIMLVFLVITIFLNTWGAKVLPMLHTISLFAHIAGFFITFIALWAMCPRNDPKDVFLDVVNSGGWSNVGTSCLISQVTVIYCNLGSDSIVHISEEVEDASLIVPRAMWWSYLVNVFSGILMLITMLFCIGPLEDVLESDVPYLTLFVNTGSSGMALFLTILVFILIGIGNITCLATCSREVWAFSRDRGLPFSDWVSRMNHKHGVPFNSVYLSSVLAGVLCLINLGSTLAFNIIVSLTLLAILSTYMLSIGCLIHKRLLNERLPTARWSLGRFGLPINIFAFFYSGFVIIFSCFPVAVPVTLDTANWAPLVWGGVILLAVVAYFLHGRTHYTPPVDFIEGKRDAGRCFQAVN